MRTFLVTLVMFGCLAALPQSAMAADQPIPQFPVTVTTTAPSSGGTFTWQHVLDVINSLVAFVLRIAGLAVTLVIVYFGFKMVTAGSDASAYGKARTGLMWALAGAVVIFGVYTIIETIRGGVDSIGR